MRKAILLLDGHQIHVDVRLLEEVDLDDDEASAPGADNEGTAVPAED